MSQTLLDIDERLCRTIGDWVQATVTTALTTSNAVVSTSLKNEDRGTDDTFNNFWCYVEDYANAGADRLIYDYATSTGTANVRGANFVSDTANLATVRITRSRWSDRKQAINDAVRECKYYLHKNIDDRTLVTGNVLPNPSFEDWTLTTIPDFWTGSGTATVAENTTAGLHRNGTSSAKLTAGAASDYFYITSASHERLLDLRDTVVDFKVWVYPEVADDAYIQIYTVKADGTAQTLTSTTSCPAAKWSLLELESQHINDDIVTIQFRCGVTTNSKYAYFDDARVICSNAYEYVLPKDLQDGKIINVSVQLNGNSDDMCDDIASNRMFGLVYGWDIVDDGTYKWLRFDRVLPSRARIRLVGYAPFAEMTAGSSTIAVSDAQINLITEYAAYLLFTRMGGLITSDDTKHFYQRAQEHLAKWNTVAPGLKMSIPTRQVKVTPL